MARDEQSVWIAAAILQGSPAARFSPRKLAHEVREVLAALPEERPEPDPPRVRPTFGQKPVGFTR